MNKASILAAALASALSLAQAADDHVGLVKNVAGHVHILRDGADLPAASGSLVLRSDELVSDRGASAGIVFEDGTLLTLGQSSRLKVRDYVFQPEDKRYAFSVYLAKGQAIYESGRIGKLSPESVKVDTPTATVGVRGTRFIVTAEE